MPPNVQQNPHQFLVRMTAFISLYQRNYRLRQMLGQQDLWLKLETFSRQIHGSLNTTEVAYLIANEARRLIEVDRISVATRTGERSVVTAISGADVVEKRSNLVQLMRALFDAVIEWGERLVYIGSKDDALPPKVMGAAASLWHFFALRFPCNGGLPQRFPGPRTLETTVFQGNRNKVPQRISRTPR